MRRHSGPAWVLLPGRVVPPPEVPPGTSFLKLTLEFGGPFPEYLDLVPGPVGPERDLLP